MTTPEGATKSQVKSLLKEFGLVSAAEAAKAAGKVTASGWYYMPVSNGMGVSGIPDFVGHFHGRFFAIETKAPGKKPTALQQFQLDALSTTGAARFVVSGQEGVWELGAWLFEHKACQECGSYYNTTELWERST